MEHTFSKSGLVIHKIILPVVSVMAGVMFLATFGQVVFRYAFNLPLAWSEELSRYLMIWTASLAAAEAYALGSHIGVNALTDSLPLSVRKWLRLFVHVVVAVLMGVIIFEGFRLSYLLMDQTSPALEIQMTWPYLAIPLGALLVLVQAVDMFIRELGQAPGKPGVCDLNAH